MTASPELPSDVRKVVRKAMLAAVRIDRSMDDNADPRNAVDANDIIRCLNWLFPEVPLPKSYTTLMNRRYPRPKQGKAPRQLAEAVERLATKPPKEVRDRLRLRLKEVRAKMPYATDVDKASRVTR